MVMLAVIELMEEPEEAPQLFDPDIYPSIECRCGRQISVRLPEGERATSAESWKEQAERERERANGYEGIIRDADRILGEMIEVLRTVPPS